MVSLHHDHLASGVHGRERVSSIREFAKGHPLNWRMLVGVAGAAGFWAVVIGLAPRFL